MPMGMTPMGMQMMPAMTPMGVALTPVGMAMAAVGSSTGMSMAVASAPQGSAPPENTRGSVAAAAPASASAYTARSSSCLQGVELGEYVRVRCKHASKNEMVDYEGVLADKRPGNSTSGAFIQLDYCKRLGKKKRDGRRGAGSARLDKKRILTDSIEKVRVTQQKPDLDIDISRSRSRHRNRRRSSIAGSDRLPT
mmetsp:Transcript_106889/g.185158  ORF Transcript_106889/g.185158 Transcript_106889/m.185158 type:complete len:195 (+) Transcript_106889:3-587(+)